MCTAVSWMKERHYFGRTLDLEYVYNEQVVITPRRFPLPCRHRPTDTVHYAMIGIATVMQDYPLYYDAVNEHGLCMAGLNFPGNAVYAEPQDGAENVAQFELLPTVLGHCRTVAQAREMLERIRVTDTPFADNLPTAQLHWIIADVHESVVLEITADGAHIYDNPVGVLTNNPPFPHQMWNLTNHRRVDVMEGDNTLAPTVELTPCSRGMGGIGLPGDASAASRFVRAAFTGAHAIQPAEEAAAVSQFFHILGSVYMVEGCVQLPDGQFDRSQYASCCNTAEGIYYYRTYHNSRTTAVHLHHTDVDATILTTYPLRTGTDILNEN